MKLKMLFFLMILNISFSAFGKSDEENLKKTAFSDSANCRKPMSFTVYHQLNITHNGTVDKFHYLAKDIDVFVWRNGKKHLATVVTPNNPVRINVCLGDKITIKTFAYDRNKNFKIIHWDSYCAILRVISKTKNNYIHINGHAFFDNKTQFSTLKNISIASNFSSIVNIYHKTANGENKIPVLTKFCE